MLECLSCLDSTEMSELRRHELDMPRHLAADLGRSAVEAAERGFYVLADGSMVSWSHLVSRAKSAKVSIPPGAALEARAPGSIRRTRVQVTNETTLGASRRLVEAGLRPLALNFANGLHPGGGFLNGARAQEEGLCRSSALYQTLVGDDMYEVHGRRAQPDSTEWVIYSPDVPVFRNDRGTPLPQPWLLSFVTCAAPYGHAIGQPQSGDLLRTRIGRVLEVAVAYDYSALVLGAWGCGAFGNDIDRTARDFRAALEGPFDGAFSEVVFAIADWSPERRFLGPFRETFSG